MGKKNINNKNKRNPFSWFLIAIVIPIIVAFTITIIILIIAGVDISSWIKEKNIPVVSSLISDSDIKNDEINKDSNKKNQKKNEEIESLNNNIVDLEETKDELELKIVKLENKEKSNKSANLNVADKINENSIENRNEKPEETNESVKKMANTFRKMDAKQAALIIEDLNKDIALDVFKSLSNDARGNILEEMELKRAAEFAESFIKDD